ncbi:MAG: helix-turn-helix domain-containing protein [Kiloniellales bacterium]|nr:helix-turn-helix domain-containing protein [Kiloniellales bacterium]
MLDNPIRKYFSTAGLAPERSLAAWRDFMAEVYYRVDVTPRCRDRLSGELEEVVLSDIGLSNFKSDEQRVFRYRNGALQDDDDNFVLIFPTRQSLFFDQRGCTGFIEPGGVVMLRSSEYYEASCPDGFENITIKIPAALMEAHVSGINDYCAKPRLPNPALAPMVRDMAKHAIVSAESLAPEQQQRLANSLMELVALLLDDCEDDGVRCVDDWTVMDRRLREVCRHIEDNIADCGLAPASVAAAHGISLRYLHKLFHRQGISFGRWVLEARLRNARRLIQTDWQRRRTLQEIAFASGFATQSHFSSRYRARYQETPSQTREAVGQRS